MYGHSTRRCTCGHNLGAHDHITEGSALLDTVRVLAAPCTRCACPNFTRKQAPWTKRNDARAAARRASPLSLGGVPDAQKTGGPKKPPK